MLVNNMVVHHSGSAYRICLNDQRKTPVCDMVFPHNDGDTFEEERVVRIMVKHMKAIWKIQ